MSTYKASESELEAGLQHILESPKDSGNLDMICRRPDSNEREVLEQGELDVVEGLVGDNWIMRGSTRTADGSAHPEMQINIMNSRVIDLVAGNRERWSLAGDQLFVDMDLSSTNLPPGTQLTVGDALLEVTEIPHTGCAKFEERFGNSAERFVNDARGHTYNLRGINARVVRGGRISVNDLVVKVT